MFGNHIYKQSGKKLFPSWKKREFKIGRNLCHETIHWWVLWRRFDKKNLELKYCNKAYFSTLFYTSGLLILLTVPKYIIFTLISVFYSFSFNMKYIGKGNCLRCSSSVLLNVAKILSNTPYGQRYFKLSGWSTSKSLILHFVTISRNFIIIQIKLIFEWKQNFKLLICFYHIYLILWKKIFSWSYSASNRWRSLRHLKYLQS